MTARNFEGCGVHVIVLGEKGLSFMILRASSLGVGGPVDSQTHQDSVRRILVILHTRPFVLTLVCSDGKVQIDLTFSHLLGKVVGMTPSMVKAGFVSAILSAGYPVELAGGGHYNATVVHAEVVEIQSLIPPGAGITLNSLYINPCQFDFQFPLWQEMKCEARRSTHRRVLCCCWYP